MKDVYGAKYGANWTSVDLYDTREFIDFHYDIHDLKFHDEEFDIVTCVSILEHIPYPEKAIQQLHRVLKPGGSIWIQLPFYYPYHESPKDYWRASPDGLRIWMKDRVGLFCFAEQHLSPPHFSMAQKKIARLLEALPKSSFVVQSWDLLQIIAAKFR